jgi:hypothetical protein
MIDPNAFANVSLPGGFTILRVEISVEPLVDGLGRDAVARTRITRNNFEITARSGLSDDEFSVTLYHEVLEAASVASASPPASVMDFNEGDFEAAAYSAHDQFGTASPQNLNRMLQSYGFEG